MERPIIKSKLLYAVPILFVFTLYFILPIISIFQGLGEIGEGISDFVSQFMTVSIIILSLANILVSIVFYRDENIDFFFNAMLILKVSLIPLFAIGSMFIAFAGLLTFVPVMFIFGIGPTLFISGNIIGGLILLFSAPYGIAYLLLAKRKKAFHPGVVVLFSIFQFFYVFDVITVFIIFLWKRRKQSYKLMLALTAVFVGVPMVFLIMTPFSFAMSEVQHRIELAFMSPEARAEDALTSESKACKQLVERFLEAADNKDPDAICKLYNRPDGIPTDLREQVDDFLSSYPGEMESITFFPDEIDNPKPLSDVFHGRFVCKKGNVEYFGRLTFYCNFSSFWLEEIVIFSEKAFCDDTLKNIEGPVCQGYFSMDYDYETTKIDGFPQIFTEYDRRITEQDVISFLEINLDIDDFHNRFGKPNATIFPYETENSLVCVVYELVSDTGEPCYVKVLYMGGEISRLTRFVGEEAGNERYILTDEGE